MSLRALVAAAAIIAILAAAVVRRRAAITVPKLVLAIVVGLSAYRSAEARVRSIHGVPVRLAGLDRPPPGAGAGEYEGLVRDALAHIPPGGAYAVVARRRTQGLFWLRYVLTPRIRVDPSRTDWVVLVGVSPRQADIHPVRVWRTRHGWLVHT
jgi:hypothetical protein